MNILARGIRRLSQRTIFRFGNKTLMTKEEIQSNAQMKKKLTNHAVEMEKQLKEDHENDRKYFEEMLTPHDKRRVDALWEILRDLTPEERQYVMAKGIVGRTQEKA